MFSVTSLCERKDDLTHPKSLLYTIRKMRSAAYYDDVFICYVEILCIACLSRDCILHVGRRFEGKSNVCVWFGWFGKPSWKFQVFYSVIYYFYSVLIPLCHYYSIELAKATPASRSRQQNIFKSKNGPPSQASRLDFNGWKRKILINTKK